MNPILKNIIAVIAGIIFGSLVNMGIINISGSLIPPPEGSDISSIEGLRASLNLFEPKHFIMPFLAHALGTFAAAFLAAKIAASHQMKFALGIGIFFLAGGISNVILLPSPLWFSILDLSVAYIPIAYLAGKLADNKS
jgi:small basic protein